MILLIKSWRRMVGLKYTQANFLFFYFLEVLYVKIWISKTHDLKTKCWGLMMNIENESNRHSTCKIIQFLEFSRWSQLQKYHHTMTNYISSFTI